MPATVAVLNGQLRVGATPHEVERLADLARTGAVAKAGARELALICARGENAGTTVSGTLVACRLAGIRVFATGGIGGVHRRLSALEPLDVSADLAEMAATKTAVVCAGAKSILDLLSTMETLETLGVPLFGLGVSQVPAFFHNESGLPIANVSLEETAAALLLRWGPIAQTGGALVANPVPSEVALPRTLVEEAIESALASASREGIRGAAVTPYLLKEVAARAAGRTLQTNVAVLESNARAAARLACLLASA